MGRYGHAGELNADAIFRASDEASYVTGVILPIDGSYTAIELLYLMTGCILPLSFFYNVCYNE